MIICVRRPFSEGATTALNVRELLGKARKRKRFSHEPAAVDSTNVAPSAFMQALKERTNESDAEESAEGEDLDTSRSEIDDDDDEEEQEQEQEQKEGEEEEDDDGHRDDAAAAAAEAEEDNGSEEEEGDVGRDRSMMRREQAREYDLDDDFIDDSEVKEALPRVGRVGRIAKRRTTARSGFFVNQGEIEMASPPRDGFHGLMLDEESRDGTSTGKSDRAKAREAKRHDFIETNYNQYNGKWLHEQPRELRDKLKALKDCVSAIRTGSRGTDDDVLRDMNACVKRQEKCRFRLRCAHRAHHYSPHRLPPSLPPFRTHAPLLRRQRLLHEVDALAREHHSRGHRTSPFLAHVMVLFVSLGKEKLVKALKHLELGKSAEEAKRALLSAQDSFRDWVTGRLSQHSATEMTHIERTVVGGAKALPLGTRWAGWSEEDGRVGKVCVFMIFFVMISPLI